MMTFRGISVKRSGKQVLSDINFTLDNHKITAVLGRNGCGKSTLISCVTCSVRYVGEILYNDQNTALMPPKERARLIAILPQLLPKTALTVKELVSMGRTPYLDIGRRLSPADIEQIERAITACGLEELSDRPADKLSGGERQKAYIAMILAQNTRVVILDEPTAYMDAANAREFMSLITELKQKHKKTILLVTHDLTSAVDIADNILVIDNKTSAFFGTAGECVRSGVIERVFGVKKSEYPKDGVPKILYY